MSNPIDERIVEMQFDNKQFERGVSQSVKSLEELKKGLDLESAAKGLDQLGRAGKRFSLDGIARGVDQISGRFSVLGTVADATIRRITNAAITSGKRMASAWTIDPVKMGFSEYETQINSVQTILANTSDAMDKAGYSQEKRLEIVSSKLDELNTYADKTIYNFTEMTRNIGTFTAAGIDLDTSVDAIKGIANLAAVSGSNSQQASTAMYQLSQALANGKVNLQDWNSVVNAGMGGEVFQKALLRTASVMGITGEKAREAFAKVQSGEISFRESLQTGWLTSDILTATLGQMAYDFEAIAKAQNITVEAAKEFVKADLLAQGYTGAQADEIINLAETATDAATKVKTLTQLFDTLKEAMQSGWTQSWEIIIGDFEEAKALFTNISDYFGDIIGASAESRNAMLSDWKALGGRNDLIEGFWNVIHSIANVTSTFKSGFEKIFPPTTAEQLANITRRFKEITGSIKAFTENSDHMGKIHVIFDGLAIGADMIREVFRGGLGVVQKFFRTIQNGVGSFLDRGVNLSEGITAFKEAIRFSERAQVTFAWMGEKAEIAGGMVANVFNRMSGALSKIPQAVNYLREWGSGIVDYAKQSQLLKRAWSLTQTYLGPMVEKTKAFGLRFGEAVRAFATAGVDASGNLWTNLKTRFSAFGNTFSGGFEFMKTSLSNGWEKTKAFFSNFFNETIPDFFGSIQLGSSNLAERLGSVNWNRVLKLALSINGVISAFKYAAGLASIGGGISNIGKNLKGIGEGLKNLAKNGIEITKIDKDSIGNTMLKIAASIGVLVASIYVLSRMDSSSVMSGIGIISLLGAELLIISTLFGKVGANGKEFLMAAGAISLLIIPIKILGDMDTKTALKGIAGVALVLAGLGFATKLAGKGFENKAAFISMALAVNLLVMAVKNLGKLSTGGLLKGVIGLEVVMMELSGFMRKSQNFKKVTGLLTMALAINMLVYAVRKMGGLKTGDLIKGVAGLSGLMFAFGTMTKLSNGNSLTGTVMTLLTMAGMMILFVDAFKQIKGMDTGSILEFSMSISAIMLSMSASMTLMSKIPITGALKGLASMAVVFAGLGGIVATASLFSGMSDVFEDGGRVLESIGRAIGSFVGGIAGGIVTGMDLPQIGSDLSAFMNNSKDFVVGAKLIDATALAGIGYLTGAILSIAGTEFLNALTSLFLGENPITSFSDDILALGEGLKGYATSIAGFSGLAKSADIERSIEAASGLAGIASAIPNTGGLWQLIVGVPDMDRFSTGITSLATGLKTYAENIVGFASLNPSDVENSIAAAQGLASLEAGLRPLNGVLQAFLGQSDLTVFGDKLPGFATMLKSFAMNISGFTTVNQADIDSAIATAQALSGIESNLTAQGGVLQKWIGERDLKTFAEKLPGVATCLKSFALNISGFTSVSESDVTSAIHTATALADVEKNLTAHGGIFQDWVGERDLGAFAGKLPGVATCLKAFATNISGFTEVKQADIDSAVNTAKALADVEKQLTGTGGVWQWLTGTQDLNLFSSNIATLGTALNSFATSIGGVSFEKKDDALSVLDMIQQFMWGMENEGGLFDSIGKFFGGSQAQALTGLSETMRVFGTDISAFAIGLGNISDAQANFEKAKTLIGDFKTFARQLTTGSKEDKVDVTVISNLISAVALGIQASGNQISTAAVTVAGNAANAVNGLSTTWNTVGGNMMIGLTNGMISKQSTVTNAATTIMRAAISAAQNTAQIASPSKVFTWMGGENGQGLANGMLRCITLIKRSASNMAQSAIDAASSTLSRFMTVTDGMDSTPVIRPVFDMSDIQNGMYAIDGMFANNRTLRGDLFSGVHFTGEASALTFDGGKIIGGTNNKDIVSQLETLNGRINTLSERMTHMQMVLDTGTLVGELAGGMDSQLGELANRKERGN